MPSFTDYLSNTNTSSIYLSDCTSEEVLNVISELQNGKSSDVPIHVVKASSKIISPVLSMLHNKCYIMNLKLVKLVRFIKKTMKTFLKMTGLCPCISNIWKNI